MEEVEDEVAEGSPTWRSRGWEKPSRGEKRGSADIDPTGLMGVLHRADEERAFVDPLRSSRGAFDPSSPSTSL